MEFFGRRWFVKRVSCFPGEYGPSMPPAMLQLLEGGGASAKVVAVASGAPEAGRRFARESRLLPVLRLLEPSGAVSALMKAMRARMMGVSSKYVSVHWRRGDRGHPEMWRGEAGPKPWQWMWSQPAHFACLVSKMVEQTGVTDILVMTNAGRAEDRDALRRYVRQWAGARVFYMQDVLPEEVTSAQGAAIDVPENLRWERWNAYDVLVAEVLLSAHPSSVMFMSAGPNYAYSSTISQFVEELRLSGGHPESSTIYLHECARPHPPDQDISISIHSHCVSGNPSVFVIDLSGLAIGVRYILRWEVNDMNADKMLGGGTQYITASDAPPGQQELHRVHVSVKVDGPLIEYTAGGAARHMIAARLLDAYALQGGVDTHASQEHTVGFRSEPFSVDPPERR